MLGWSLLWVTIFATPLLFWFVLWCLLPSALFYGVLSLSSIGVFLVLCWQTSRTGGHTNPS
jgi:hypothetical protein